MQYQMTESHNNDLARRMLRLVAAMAIFILVVFVLAPLPIKYFAPMAHYVKTAEQRDIHPGALYYSDVSVTRESEFNNRDTVRYYYNLQKKQAVNP